MIYIVDHIEQVSDAWMRKALSLLPPQRRAHAMNYRQLLDQQLSAIAYLLLRYGLRMEHGIDLTSDFDHTTEGKPYLANMPDVHFSISHCSKAVAVAIAKKPLGIDIETFHTCDADVVAYCCNDKEQLQIKEAQNPHIKFTEIWTKKESKIKRDGGTTSPSLKDVYPTTQDTFFTIINNSYVCTTCTDTAAQFTVKRIELNQLI